jgi:hypothetical protein
MWKICLKKQKINSIKNADNNLLKILKTKQKALRLMSSANLTPCNLVERTDVSEEI